MISKGECFKTDKNIRVVILITMKMLTWYAVFQRVFCYRFHATRSSISTGTPPSARVGVEFNDNNSYTNGVYSTNAVSETKNCKFAPLSVAMSIPVVLRKTRGGETLIIEK